MIHQFVHLFLSNIIMSVKSIHLLLNFSQYHNISLLFQIIHHILTININFLSNLEIRNINMNILTINRFNIISQFFVNLFSQILSNFIILNNQILMILKTHHTSSGKYPRLPHTPSNQFSIIPSLLYKIRRPTQLIKTI